MFNHSAFRLIVMSVALTSVLVACGQQEGSNNKTIIKKSLPAPQTTTPAEEGGTATAPGEDSAQGTPITDESKDKITASEACPAPFENFAPQSEEREVSFADLLNPNALQLSADLKDKAVEFRLVEVKEWIKRENIDSKTADEMSGELTTDEGRQSKLNCHTIRVDRKAEDGITHTSAMPLVLDLSTGKISKLVNLTLKSAPGEGSAQAFETNGDFEIKTLEKTTSAVGQTAQVVLNRLGEKHLIIRRQVDQLEANGQFKVTARSSAVYEAVEKSADTASVAAETEQDEPASQD